MALLKQITRSQPLITLHGHIHETVDASNGKFKEVLGKSFCYSAGNKWKNELSYILVSTEEPHAGQRLKAGGDAKQKALP